MSVLQERAHHAFPTLTPAEVQAAGRFASGDPRRFAPGAPLYQVGERNVSAWLVLEGAVEVVRRDGRGVERPIVVHGPGQMTGEVSQLSGAATLATGRAGPRGAVAAPFDAAHLRALVVGSAEVGETLMRAFILRRLDLIEAGGSGSVLLGVPGSREMLRLEGFLRRNNHPVTVLDAGDVGEGRDLVERLGVRPEYLPLMLCPDGSVLRRPSDRAAAACLGVMPELDTSRVYDVAVVGAGPAGLATAVYAASEGLSVLVVDQRGFGGQAGASARIENYLGFPTGVSGAALAGRAYHQAQKFGAEIAVPVEAVRLGPELAGGRMSLCLGEAGEVRARTAVVASGARYRRPAITNLSCFEGVGVSYWASPVEARLCEGQEVALVGAGNSAGQAAVFLAPRVERLHLIVRGTSLEASMSAYLVARIAALPNVVLHLRTEVEALAADAAGTLCGAALRSRDSGERRELPIRHLFLFIGADPNTAWLGEDLALDSSGFALTGDIAAAHADTATRLSLETSRRGVFAIGDVRAGSTKRVGAAIGEGAAVVSQLHSALAR